MYIHTYIYVYLSISISISPFISISITQAHIVLLAPKRGRRLWSAVPAAGGPAAPRALRKEEKTS